MSFRVFLHPKAAEFLSRSSHELKERIKERLRELESEPEKKGTRLSYSAFYRMRIGDYRAVYTIDREAMRVLVLFIGHRRDVYDDFSRIL